MRPAACASLSRSLLHRRTLSLPPAAKIQNDLRILTERLARINDNLARKITSRNEYDKTIQETEAAYSKVRLLLYLCVGAQCGCTAMRGGSVSSLLSRRCERSLATIGRSGSGPARSYWQNQMATPPRWSMRIAVSRAADPLPPALSYLVSFAALRLWRVLRRCCTCSSASRSTSPRRSRPRRRGLASCRVPTPEHPPRACAAPGSAPRPPEGSAA